MKLKLVLFSVFTATLASATYAVNSADNRNEISAALAVTDSHSDYFTYTVVKGDTSYSIAKKLGISLKELYKLNPQAESGLKAGMKLRIERKITSYRKHKVNSKETLFALSQQYGVSVDDITKANKKLKNGNLQSGKEVLIPIYNSSLVNNSTSANTASQAPTTQKREEYGNPYNEHKVAKGETLYSIARNYGVSIETLFNLNDNLTSGLKEGMTLRIPKKQIEPIINNRPPAALSDKENAPEKIKDRDDKKVSVIRVGVLLPFIEDAATVSKSRTIEYYNGFLLAVKELKEKGYDAEIYSFDIGTDDDTRKLTGLLETVEMKNLNLIIGGVSKAQIDAISKFSKKNNINYIIPFDARTTAIDNNPKAFRMTTSPSSMYAKVSESFVKTFKGNNIIFVTEAGSDNSKGDLVAGLKKELTSANVAFKTISSKDDLTTELQNKAGSGRNIIVPTSSSEASLRRALAAMDNMQDATFTLFGYPEWQTYTGLFTQLHKYDTYIYSIFFLNDSQPQVQEVDREYKLWYNKLMVNSYPRFAYLGYDAGLYFMTALHERGIDFAENINAFKVPALQSAIFFEKEGSKGGYINTGLYFVRFKTNSTIEKLSLNR